MSEMDLYMVLDQDEDLKEKMAKMMGYIAKIRENGELDIFAAIFQTDFRILAYLMTHQDAHPSIMADSLKVTRPNIAANLRLLESKGYIVREIDDDNRRQVYVNITEEGKKYYKVCEKQMSLLFAGWFAILGEELTESLFKILEISSDPELMTDDLKHFSFGA